MVFFALATCLLAGPDATVLAISNSDTVSQAKLAEPQARFSYLLDFFLWHLLEEVPLLSINKTLHWKEPLEHDLPPEIRTTGYLRMAPCWMVS